MIDDQQLLYDWTLIHLRLLKPNGELLVPDPAPLSTEQICEVLGLIAKAPEYQHQLISVPDREGNRSVLRDGEVEASASQDAPHPQVMPYGASLLMREQ